MINDSYFGGFILLGFPGRPQLEMIISGAVFFFYTIALIGNIAIILLPLLDERLQIPMYFFLRNLAILDLCYTTNIVPQMLVNVWGKDKKISFSSCAFQLFIDVTLCTVECMLLGVMSYDRFNAVCKPLHYMTIMSPQLCQGLVIMTWIIGIINGVILSPYAMSLPRCENHLDHYFCEISAMVKIACVDTKVMEEMLFASCFFIFLPPLLLILVSYSFIAVAVLKIKCAAGRQKAFGTCSSHLIVVSIFYGTVIYMYIQPGNSPSQDEGKLLSIFYSIVTPSLNPLIYTLRNKEFKGAMKKLVRKEKPSEETVGH